MELGRGVATGGGTVAAAQTSWARWATDGPPSHERLSSSGTDDGWASPVVRAMARHRWRHSQYVGLTGSSSTPDDGRTVSTRGGRGAGGGEIRRGGTDGAGHYLLWRPESERD